MTLGGLAHVHTRFLMDHKHIYGTSYAFWEKKIKLNKMFVIKLTVAVAV